MLIVVIEAVTANAAEAQRLLAEARPLCAATREEKGCLDYSFALDCVDSASVRVIERWQDQAAMSAHLKMPYLEAFMGFMQSVTVKSMSAKVYDASGERDLFRPAVAE